MDLSLKQVLTFIHSHISQLRSQGGGKEREGGRVGGEGARMSRREKDSLPLLLLWTLLRLQIEKGGGRVTPEVISDFRSTLRTLRKSPRSSSLSFFFFCVIFVAVRRSFCLLMAFLLLSLIHSFSLFSFHSPSFLPLQAPLLQCPTSHSSPAAMSIGRKDSFSSSSSSPPQEQERDVLLKVEELVDGGAIRDAYQVRSSLSFFALPPPLPPPLSHSSLPGRSINGSKSDATPCRCHARRWTARIHEWRAAR